MQKRRTLSPPSPLSLSSSSSSSSSSNHRKLIIEPIGVNLVGLSSNLSSSLTGTNAPVAAAKMSSSLKRDPNPDPGIPDDPNTLAPADINVNNKPRASIISVASSSSSSTNSSSSTQIHSPNSFPENMIIDANHSIATGVAAAPGTYYAMDVEEDVPIFSELSQLCETNLPNQQQQQAWKETARWVKFEENVEESGTRWSKPYVSTVNVASFLELKRSLSSGVVVLDSSAASLENVVDEFLQLALLKAAIPDEETASQLCHLLLLKKWHQFQTKRSFITSIADLRAQSTTSFLKLASRSSSKINCSTIETSNQMTRSQSNHSLKPAANDSNHQQHHHQQQQQTPSKPSSPQLHPHLRQLRGENLLSGNGGLIKNSYSSSNLAEAAANDTTSHRFKYDSAFRKKIPPNAQSNNILIAEVDFLTAPVSGFFRLRTASNLGELTEVSIATKFIFIYFAPKASFFNPTTTTTTTEPRTTTTNNNNNNNNSSNVGRALATLMSDDVFRSVALRAQSIDPLLYAIDEFIAEAPILPPNLWDPSIRLEPPDKTPAASSQSARRNNSYQTLNNNNNDIDQLHHSHHHHHHHQHQHQHQSAEPFTNGVITSKIRSNSNNNNNNNNQSSMQSYYNHAFDHGSKESMISATGGAGAGGGGGGDHPSSNKMASTGIYLSDKIEISSDDEAEIEREQMGLVYSGRLFGGLINDIKRKLPHYRSDFSDAFALQSIASIIYLYFACLTPIITFGGLLGDATGNNIATMESLICGAICGTMYGLFSGQPLMILGSTGPVLVFETILYDFCRTNDYDYLSIRFWIGMWIAAILFVFVAIDASYLVCYITRFTEENFASLISVIFIYKAIEKLLDIEDDYPVNTRDDISRLNYQCACMYRNESTGESISFTFQNDTRNETAIAECERNSGILFGRGCDTPAYVPDVFLFSVLLMIATYVTSVQLKNFRHTRFFGAKTREFFSDFAVPIAITVATVIDNVVGLRTPKLEVPSNFEPTIPDRGWLVNPFSEKNPIWLPFVALFPAILGTILIFMDQQITAVIINRKEYKLKKGGGYHLDLFVLCLLIAICSVFGLPWFVAATVLSLTHVNSLMTYSETAAPGDKPKFLGIREQRLTHVSIFVLCGLSIFFTPVLQRIPMPVLYGVFLYMGVSSLNGSQFIDRIMIMFMPPKYQPDYMFLRRVNITRIHMFTLIQLVCFVFLWIVKSYKPISITFPLMLLVILGVRKLLDYVFTQEELKTLDHKMPESKRKKKERLRAKLAITAKDDDSEQQKKSGNEKSKSLKQRNGGARKDNASSAAAAGIIAGSENNISDFDYVDDERRDKKKPI